MLAQILSTANTVRRLATGEATAADEELQHHIYFLTTLVTYPALYIFATASGVEPPAGEVPECCTSGEADDQGGQWAASVGLKPHAEALVSEDGALYGISRAPAQIPCRPAAAAPMQPCDTVLTRTVHLPFQRALPQDEVASPEWRGRWGAAGAAQAAFKRIVPKGQVEPGGGGAVEAFEVSSPVMALAPEPRYRLSDFPEGRALVVLERWCREPVYLGLGGELWAHIREYSRGCLAAGLLPPWLASSLRAWLDAFPDAAPPMRLEAVVEAAVREAREGARAEEASITEGAGPTLLGGPVAVGWEGGLPLRRLAAAVNPNLAQIGRAMMQRYRLSRGRTWLEFAQIFLGIFRSWLRLVATWCSLAAMVLRLMGTGSQVLSGAVAFTVVFSIALSVLSALLTIAATAAEAIASLLRGLASATESVYSRSRGPAVRQQLEGDLVGPRILDPANIEELEDLFLTQVAHRMKLRSRPDVARLEGDLLLLRAYDMKLVDGGGGVMVDNMVAVEERFESGGFFGLASATMRKAGAVLLLRLLAWKRVGLCSKSEALKYVFVLGARGAGRTTAFAGLVNLSADYQVPPSVPAEIRPIPRVQGAYAVLVSGLDSRDPRVSTRAKHFADLDHGVLSVLVYVVSAEARPDPELLDRAVWQSLAARKSTLLLVSKGTKLTEQLLEEPRAVEQLKADWLAVLHEGAARQGLEADTAEVLVAEMRDAVPPAGVDGPQQVREKVAEALGRVTLR